MGAVVFFVAPVVPIVRVILDAPGGETIQHDAEDLVFAVAQGAHVQADVFPIGAVEATDVDDLVDAFSRAVAAPAVNFRRFNIATGSPCSLPLLAEEVAALVPGCRVHHEGVPQPIVRMDATKAQRELGWLPVAQRQRLRQVIDAITP